MSNIYKVNRKHVSIVIIILLILALGSQWNRLIYQYLLTLSDQEIIDQLEGWDQISAERALENGSSALHEHIIKKVEDSKEKIEALKSK